MDNDPEEIINARTLLEEFEKAPGISKRASFEDGITILNEFLGEHPDSEFAGKAHNLKVIYVKQLIKKLTKLGTTVLSTNDLRWLLQLQIIGEIIKVLESDPKLKEDWGKLS